MKQFIKDFLTYSKGEQRGIIVLAFILLLILLINFSLKYWHTHRSLPVEAFKEKVQELQRSDTSIIKEKEVALSTPHRLFAFNPNKLSDKKKWRQLGLSEKVIATIANYKEAGGEFVYKRDFKKVYGLSEKKYQQLKPYLKLPTYSSSSSSTSSSPPSPVDTTPASPPDVSTRSKVPLNRADSATLEGVFGIGPYFAGAIVKYRRWLGGFYSKKQLLEVYGLDTADYRRIRTHIVLQDTLPDQYNINRASVEDLGKHPYISWQLAHIIRNYVEQHGAFDSLPAIKEVEILTDSLYYKIKPYLTVAYDSSKS